MHHLLIQQAIIDEIHKQAFAGGNKALDETRFNGDNIQPALLAKGIKCEEIEKWLAYLSLQEYIKLTADDHTRNPFYITLEKKGLEAHISKYFIEQRDDKKREVIRSCVQISSQFILGTVGLIAFLITTGKSCTSTTKLQSEFSKEQKTQTAIFANSHDRKASYDTVTQRLFYLDTIFVGVDTVFLDK